MQLSRLGLFIALAAMAPSTLCVDADDGTAMRDLTLHAASKEVPVYGHVRSDSLVDRDDCDDSGVVGYMYCRGADWTAWLFSMDNHHASPRNPRDALALNAYDAQRRLQWGSASGMRYATRSSMPMHKYLRQVELKDSNRTGADVPTKTQVNSVKYNGDAPKIANPAYSVVPQKYADHRVKQVNGIKNPVVKCANIAPNDPRKCVKSTGGRGGLRRKNYEKLPYR